MSTTYTAQARPVGRLWHVDVPQLRRSTQARSLKDVPVMAADLIEAMTDVEVDPSTIEVEYELPPEVQRRLTLFEAARQAAARAQAEAADEQRAAAREMIALGYSRRETGILLGISHQRVQQLVKA